MGKKSHWKRKIYSFIFWAHRVLIVLIKGIVNICLFTVKILFDQIYHYLKDSVIFDLIKQF